MRHGPPTRVLAVAATGLTLLAGCASPGSGDGAQASPEATPTPGPSATGTPHDGSSTEPPLSTRNVLVVGTADLRFRPDRIVLDTSSQGRYEITFTVPTGSPAHTLESDQIPLSSGRVAPGQTLRLTFAAEPGTYRFFCRYHRAQGMTGTLILR